MDADAEVVVVGAGPAGCATAIHCATAGLDVVLLDKARFPRGKVCGDGLTPRAVAELQRLGVDLSGREWKRISGLRVHATRTYDLPWPQVDDLPDHALTRRRADFDAVLLDRAVAAGARVIQGARVTAPLLDERTGRVVGVVGERAVGADQGLRGSHGTRGSDQGLRSSQHGKARGPRSVLPAQEGSFTLRAPVVVGAEGNAATLAKAVGVERDPARPLGVAVRTYFRSPLADSEWMESWLELWDGKPGHSHLLPGYAWSFPMPDGTCNVGLGLPSASRSFQQTNYRDLLARWVVAQPLEWTWDDAHRVGTTGSAALPMGFARHPAYRPGLLLVGDAAGVVNPFNGEGISYAMESGRYAAASIVRAHELGLGTRRAEPALEAYGRALREAWGGYFRLGAVFLQAIGHPAVMRIAARRLLPLPGMARLVHQLLGNFTGTRPRDAVGWIVHTLSRLTPAA